jgi:hypothetical protein
MMERQTAAVGSESGDGFGEPTLSLFTQEYTRAVAMLTEEGVLENVVNVQFGMQRDDIVIPDTCRCQAKGEGLYGDATRRRTFEHNKIGIAGRGGSSGGIWRRSRKQHADLGQRTKTKKPRMLVKKKGYITIDGVTVIPSNKYPCYLSQAKFDKVFGPVRRGGNYGQRERNLLQHQHGGDFIRDEQASVEHHNGNKNVLIESTGLMVDHFDGNNNDYSADIKTRTLSMGRSGSLSSMSQSSSKPSMMMGQLYQRKRRKRSPSPMPPATMTIMYMKKWFKLMQRGEGMCTNGNGCMMNIFTGMSIKKMKHPHRNPPKKPAGMTVYIEGLFPCLGYV